MVLRLPLCVSKGLYTHCRWMPSSQTGTLITRVALQKTQSLSTGQMQVLSPRGPWIPVEVTLRTSCFCFWCMVAYASHTSDISWAELVIHPSLSALGSDGAGAWCSSCGLFPSWLVEASWCESKPGVWVHQCVLSTKHCDECLCHACVCKSCVRPATTMQGGGQSCCPFISSTISSWEARPCGSSPAFPLVLVC